MENDNINDQEQKALDWDDSIQNDGQDFIILAEDDYNYTVTGFERGHFPGSQKIPACNKASLTLRINTDKGSAICHTDLILYSSLEWRLAGFFRSIGMKKKGERLVMDWTRVQGAVGRAHFKPRTYKAKDGSDRTVNNLDYYIDYDEENFPNGGFVPAGDEPDELPFT